MEDTLRSHLRACCDAYCAATGLAVTTVGRKAARDPLFFIFGGAREVVTFTIRKYDVVMAWFAQHWPKDIAWPAGVPRPSPSTPPVVDAAVGPTAASVGRNPAPAALSVRSHSRRHLDSS